MSNIAGKAYAMNVVTPSNRKITWINRTIFMVFRCLPGGLKGLLGLKLIHFARWVFIKPYQWPDLGQGPQDLQNDYVLFCSNFNGTWDQYIDAFSDGIPLGLDLFWYSSIKYPKSIPITPFKNYITFNQVNTDYYYNATPGAAQRDIKTSLAVYNQIEELTELHRTATPEAFAEAYKKAALVIQNGLGDPGFGPVASLDTERAQVNRYAYADRLHGKDDSPASPAKAGS